MQYAKYIVAETGTISFIPFLNNLYKFDKFRPPSILFRPINKA